MCKKSILTVLVIVIGLCLAGGAYGASLTIVDLPATNTDAAIGIDPAKTYTHTLDFGNNAPTTINGVAFDQGPTENVREPYVGVSSQGYGYIVDDTRSDVKINPHGGDDPSSQADGASAEMLKDMIYYSSAVPNEGIILTLLDLAPGTGYSVRWYYRVWDAALPRPITIIADGGESIDIDIDLGGAHYLDYTFVADDDDVTMTFICNVNNQGPHLYGITCEEASAAPAMVAHWPLDDGAGTTAVDVVGGNDGTLMGSTTWITDGALGGAVQFGGIDGNRIEMPNTDAIDFADEDFSVSIWIRYPEGSDPNGISNKWFMKGTSGSPGTGSRYELFMDNSGEVRFTIDNGPDNKKSRAAIGDPSLVVTGDWVNLVGVRDAANDLMSLYIDSVLVATQVDNSGDISNGEPLVIGEHAPGGDTMLGDIDDIRIYDVALTEDDIASICPPAPAAPAMVAHWPMDNGAGTVATDVVGGHDGELVGSVSWIDGALDGAVTFDTTDPNSSIYVPDDAELDFGDVDFSISMMVRYPVAPPSAEHEWITKGSYGGDTEIGSRYAFYHKNTEMRFDIDNGPANIKSSLSVSDAPVVTGEWVHMVAVRDAVNGKMYIYADGVLQGELVETSGDISSPGEHMYIGNSLRHNAPCEADLDDVRIFPSALTEDDIAAIYPASLPTPIADYSFDVDASDATGMVIVPTGIFIFKVLAPCRFMQLKLQFGQETVLPRL